MYFIYFLLFIINCSTLQSKLITNEKPIASACIDSNGLNGTCNFIDSCSYVRQLKLSGRKYYRCGFENHKEVVCCAKREIPSVVTDSLNTSRRHVQECEQYKSNLFDTSFYLTRLTASGQTVSKHTSKCSQYTFPLIVGGENARPKEFPHMALLGCKNATGGYIWSCGGSLISTNYILTAAHCFEAKECEEITVVRLGDLDVEAENDDAQPHDFVVERIIPHPQYNSSLKYNDIGLVKLKTEANITFYIRPACLPYTNYDNRSTLIISGWGSRQLGKGNAAFLQKAPVEEFSHDECNETYTEGDSMSLPEGIKDNSQICAGSRHHNIDTCYGDSGGPLQTVHPYYSCMYSIIGVTSFGQLCGSPGVPGVYTRVYNYNDWIESIVWK